MNILDLFRKKKKPQTQQELVDEFYKNVNAKLGDSFGPVENIAPIDDIDIDIDIDIDQDKDKEREAHNKNESKE